MTLSRAPGGPASKPVSSSGEVAKWLGNGLQNRHTPVRIRSSPPRKQLKKPGEVPGFSRPGDWDGSLGHFVHARERESLRDLAEAGVELAVSCYAPAVDEEEDTEEGS